jgi:hypothetical protein
MASKRWGACAVAVLLALAAYGTLPARTVPAESTAKWTTLVTVPWGKGAGKLGREHSSPLARRGITGPACLQLNEDGSFAILDPVDLAIQEFSSAGAPVRRLSLVPFQPKDGELIPMALASPRRGEYGMLALGQPVLYYIDAQRRGYRYGFTLASGDAPRDLFALEQDRLGVLTQRGQLIVLGLTGQEFSRQPVPRRAFVDSLGRAYQFRATYQDVTMQLELMRVDQKQVDSLVTLKGGSQTRVHVVGIDQQNTVYVLQDDGFGDEATELELLRFAPGVPKPGKNKLPAQHITSFAATRSVGVTPKGVMYALQWTSQGCKVLCLGPLPAPAAPPSPSPSPASRPKHAK